MNSTMVNLARPRAKATLNPNERRIAMTSLWKLTFVAASAGLLLAAPLPAFGQAPQRVVTLSVTPASPQPVGTQLTLTATLAGPWTPANIILPGVGHIMRYSFSAMLLPSGPTYQIYTGANRTANWFPPNGGDYRLAVTARQFKYQATASSNYHVSPQHACSIPIQNISYPSQATVGTPFSVSAAVSVPGYPPENTNKFLFGFSPLPGSGAITCTPNPVNTGSLNASTSCTAAKGSYLPEFYVQSYQGNVLYAECWTHGQNYITVTP